MYYEDGFSHHFELHVLAVRVGIVANVIDYRHGVLPGLKVHLDYMNFGSVHMTSDDAQDASDFSSKGQVGGYNAVTQSCFANNCGAFRQFASTGGLQLIALTFEPYWQHGKWQFGVEAGPTLFRSTWQSVATVISPNSPWGTQGSVEVLTHQPHLQVGSIVGASVSYGHASLQYDYVFTPVGSSTGTNVPAGFSGAHMVTMNYEF
jgi:hypothetical protein